MLDIASSVSGRSRELPVIRLTGFTASRPCGVDTNYVYIRDTEIPVTINHSKLENNS